MTKWVKIHKYDYSVSSKGRVKNNKTGVVLKNIKITQPNTVYYAYAVTLCRDTKHKRFYVHILVCEAFHGPRPKGMQVRHIDGNPDNLYYKNLKWGTIQQNNDDKKIHGTVCIGENHGISKTNEKDVIKMRNEYEKEGTTHKSLAVKYGLSRRQVGDIINRKVWKHV